MNYVGDYTAGDTVFIPFNTFDSNDPSASVTMTNFVNTDVHIHNALNLTQRNNAAGVTVDVDVDGITGCHGITIDTSDNTVADFFVSGADYGVRIEGVTVDAATLNPWVGHFSIENRHVAGSMVRTTIATLASQVSFTLTAGSADDDAYNNCTAVITDIASGIQKAVGRVSDYTGATKTVTLAVDPGIFTMAASDRIHIFATSALANMDAVGGTVQTAGDIPALVTTLDTVADGIQTDLDNGTDGLGALKTLIDALNDLSAAQANAEADTALSDFFTSAAALVDLVYDEARSGHTTQGTYGEQFVSVISATVDTVTNTHTPTTTEFQADDITEATADHFNGRIVIWQSGVLLGQATDITDYVAVGGIGQFTTTALTEAPSNDDEFIIV